MATQKIKFDKCEALKHSYEIWTKHSINIE